MCMQLCNVTIYKNVSLIVKLAGDLRVFLLTRFQNMSNCLSSIPYITGFNEDEPAIFRMNETLYIETCFLSSGLSPA